MRTEIKCFDKVQWKETHESLTLGLKKFNRRYSEWKELSPLRQAALALILVLLGLTTLSWTAAFTSPHGVQLQPFISSSYARWALMKEPS